MIISLHIPKTAGTSLLTILKNAYGNRLLQHNTNPRFTYQTDFRELSQEYDIIHGHISLSKAECLLSNRTFLFTFLRDPVQRVISSYYFHSRPETRNELAKHVRNHQMSIWEFADLPSQKNLQYNMLKGVEKENVDFFGFSEDFATSVQQLSSVLHFDFDSDVYSNLNPEKRVGVQYEIDPDLNKFIYERNQKDWEIYCWAREKFFG